MKCAACAVVYGAFDLVPFHITSALVALVEESGSVRP